ncbi:hypothetical protein L2E82_34690 [Cichorium intybus]|uniref:Uncharacterized protein n=1 Tax=Cichorium intybus TaxID=13427 RepID=A0ACB9BMJ7_CICIN|nr:hypothetical protein L2E82_34690 [Cichorium intybus]
MHSKLKSRTFKTIEFHSSSPSCCCLNEASSVSANAVLSHCFLPPIHISILSSISATTHIDSIPREER